MKTGNGNFIKDSLILIGMPGCGKSTVGVLLAKVLCLSFLDTDLLLQETARRPLQEIVDLQGLAAFRALEERALLGLSGRGMLIATGGSAIYSDAAMRHLASLGTIVYLKRSLSVIKDNLGDFSRRGIVMPGGMTIDELYLERAPLYERYADLTVELAREGAAESMERVRLALRASAHPLFS